MQKTLVLMVAMILASCSGSKSDSPSSTNSRLVPELSPLVKESLAESLQPASLRLQRSDYRALANSSQAVEALSDFFGDNFASISGTTKEGLIFAFLADIDGRTLELQTSDNSEPTCLSATPVNSTFTAHAGHALTLKLSCARAFGGSGDQSGAGSGLAFGRDDDYHYLYLVLTQQSNANDKFGYAAKVHRTNRTVEVLFMERNVTYNRVKFFRLIAKPDDREFELSIAGTSDGVGPISTQTTHVLSPGARFITDGTAIKADGNVAVSTNSSGAATPSAFAFDSSECLSVANLSSTTSCGTLAFSMDLVAATALSATDMNTNLKTISTLISDGVTEDESSAQ